ncbi:Rhamnolipids biosynthesis 3-oxoacyl-[acyl-carrier-protein] reductase [Metarhizium brunneum]|uniref:Hydroxynaphthalene reductase-like protein Arp2 n=1 Tax=Metarhizium brunneum TaxID=500148 RepID=A0A7D5UYV3_9HYPO|nr:Rhamnolipids biosynthesis 3-oxoacyl-[acyl-carrier-protein] reductase [Metarhizium anisopliae]QLI70654.1 Rhamnolipids biosynthesis 3-oxoacyl-[acyl-carrier-protein] reductase [Metarhizium brunneum]
MDINTLFGVQGKVVLITGGAKGIGRMIATGFVTNGAKVYITGRDAPACHAAVADLAPLARLSGSIHALPANLQNLDECQALAASLARLEPGGLHVLVNNAGATWGADIDSHPDAAWTKLLTLNLQRAFTLTQLCLPLLERAGSQDDPARVIHVGSIDGVRVPSLANYAYSASKAGLHHLSRHLARDLGFRNVTSNVLACGPFRTKMMKATLDAAEDVLKENIPLRRIGRDEDVAGSAVFLASKAGAYLNGALIRVDGGASLVAKI